MKVDFKKPKYVLPIIIIPFLFLFFYIYKGYAKDEKNVVKEEGLQSSVQDVSDDVKNKQFDSKLDSYMDKYKNGDGYSAIQNITEDQYQENALQSNYTDREKAQLDSINEALNKRYGTSNSVNNNVPSYGNGRNDNNAYQPQKARMSEEDRMLAEALSKINNAQNQSYQNESPKRNEDDPMKVFQKQMAMIDSMNRVNDPDYIAEKKREQIARKKAEQQSQLKERKLEVEKIDIVANSFNTIKKEKELSFIKAIIDENITGYAGSRLRLRLLDDIRVGGYIIEKGSYLYANITGFSMQRVTFSISSILKGDKILPIKLDLYDNDGMPGLYVPASAFREFSKELGANATSGLTLDGTAENSNQLIMGVLQKMFMSTTTAATEIIRKNKANIKYNTWVYLIDPDEHKKK